MIDARIVLLAEPVNYRAQQPGHPPLRHYDAVMSPNARVPIVCLR